MISAFLWVHALVTPVLPVSASQIVIPCQAIPSLHVIMSGAKRAVFTNATTTQTIAWQCIRQKESGDNYQASGLEIDGGAYQFSEATWLALGYSGTPSQASPQIQNQAALKLYHWDIKYTGNPWSAWETAPLCGL